MLYREKTPGLAVVAAAPGQIGRHHRCTEDSPQTLDRPAGETWIQVGDAAPDLDELTRRTVAHIIAKARAAPTEGERRALAREACEIGLTRTRLMFGLPPYWSAAA